MQIAETALVGLRIFQYLKAESDQLMSLQLDLPYSLFRDFFSIFLKE